MLSGFLTQIGLVLPSSFLPMYFSLIFFFFFLSSSFFCSSPLPHRSQQLQSQVCSQTPSLPPLHSSLLLIIIHLLVSPLLHKEVCDGVDNELQVLLHIPFILLFSKYFIWSCFRCRITLVPCPICSPVLALLVKEPLLTTPRHYCSLVSCSVVTVTSPAPGSPH